MAFLTRSPMPPCDSPGKTPMQQSRAPRRPFEATAEDFLRPDRHANKYQREMVLELKPERGHGGSSEPWYRLTDRLLALRVCHHMEEIHKEIELVNQQVLESKKILEDLSNQIQAIADVVQPKIEARTKEIRALRMTLVQELNQAL